MFGLDGIEIGLIITFACLFGAIMSGYPVAFAIGGAGVVSFFILAGLDSAGLITTMVIDTRSAEYLALIDTGVARDTISHFRYPELPEFEQPLFAQGWQDAVKGNLSFFVNRMNDRVFAGPSLETLLAVAMFVLMGITLERSRIANDLLTTMARVFGPLPGGLAVSIVVVGAFLAASTGIVGATVVTMGLLALPTMLRNNYSPELATGVISASGTLGQIIPPSIVIVLLGTLAGDIYSTAQEQRAETLQCPDALTLLGEAAVLSVGTLFQAAILPGIFLAGLYAAYAFGFALIFPDRAPPVDLGGAKAARTITGRYHGLTWYLAVPAGIIGLAFMMNMTGVSGSQDVRVSSVSDIGAQAELRTNVNETCAANMIAKHGQEKWDRAVAQQAVIDASGDTGAQQVRSPEEIATLRAERIAAAAPISIGLLVYWTLAGLTLAIAYGVAPNRNNIPLYSGVAGIGLALATDALFISPVTSPGLSLIVLIPAIALIFVGMRDAFARLGENELLRVVFPPLILIVAVLGSILGGITNPTPAAALGAAGAILLAAFRKLKDRDDADTGRSVLMTAFAIVIMLLVGVNFDLRINLEDVPLENWVAYLVALGAYLWAMGGIFYACWVLFKDRVLTPVVRETAKVTSMVFAILIGSQLLNLVVISYGGEHYIQEFLKSFDNEIKVFLIVMVVLFILGFVLDFLEIIYIVVPIVGPVIYGGALDPKWVTIMIAVNLQTSFLTPPFGFALFYLRGVAPPEVTTQHIYRGVVPFVLIQVLGLALLWLFPAIVTIVPDLLG